MLLGSALPASLVFRVEDLDLPFFLIVPQGTISRALSLTWGFGFQGLFLLGSMPRACCGVFCPRGAEGPGQMVQNVLQVPILSVPSSSNLVVGQRFPPSGLVPQALASYFWFGCLGAAVASPLGAGYRDPLTACCATIPLVNPLGVLEERLPFAKFYPTGMTEGIVPVLCLFPRGIL